MLSVGALLPYLLLREVGCLRCHERKNFLRLAWENEVLWKALFLWNQPLEFPRPRFSSLCQGESPILLLAKLGLTLLFHVYTVQSASGWLSLCSQLQSIATWLWREHGESKEAGGKRGQKRRGENSFVSGFNLPGFCTFAVAPPPMANDLCSRLGRQTPSLCHPTLLHMHPSHLCPVPSRL